MLSRYRSNLGRRAAGGAAGEDAAAEEGALQRAVAVHAAAAEAGDLARRELTLDGAGIEEALAGELVHALDEVTQVALDDEVGALLHEGAHWGGCAAASAGADDLGPAAAGEVRVLLGAGEGELALDDL